MHIGGINIGTSELGELLQIDVSSPLHETSISSRQAEVLMKCLRSGSFCNFIYGHLARPHFPVGEQPDGDDQLLAMDLHMSLSVDAGPLIVTKNAFLLRRLCEVMLGEEMQRYLQ